MDMSVEEASVAGLVNEQWISGIQRHLTGDISVVLDVGAGTGALSWHLGQVLDAHVICLEKSPTGLGAVKEFPDERTIPMRADAVRIPLRDNSVDLVFTSKLIYLLNDRSAFAQEVARVLRPGGWIAVRSYLSEFEEVQDFKFFPEFQEISEGNVFSCADIQNLLGAVGFKDPQAIPAPELVALSWGDYLNSAQNDTELVDLIGSEAHQRGVERIREFLTTPDRREPVLDQLGIVLMQR